MRGVLTFIAIAAIGGGFFVWQKQNEQRTAASEPPTATQRQTAPNAVLTPAPRGQASEYNWMKRSLDRAADVRDQARSQTKEAQDP